LSYFQDILGGSPDDYTISLASPFPSKNLCLLITDNISTKYKYRENSYDRIVEQIKTAVSYRPGNYIVYFPSYKYLSEVYSRFTELYPEIDTIIQESIMTEEEREAFLDSLQPNTAEAFVAFGVLGGIFSEGVDLKGDRLIGVIIIGVGLPQLSAEQNIVMRYFQLNNGMGYEYAYMYPGMNKVLQAAGRVIRSENDKGIALLIDERFSQQNYRTLYPEHWNYFQKTRSNNDLEISLAKFWKGFGQ